jgi:hypothetical protein
MTRVAAVEGEPYEIPAAGTLWRFLFFKPSSRGRFRRIDRSCRWTGTHQEQWQQMNHGHVLIAQCSKCRRVVAVVVQQPASDWPGCVD